MYTFRMQHPRFSSFVSWSADFLNVSFIFDLISLCHWVYPPIVCHFFSTFFFFFPLYLLLFSFCPFCLHFKSILSTFLGCFFCSLKSTASNKLLGRVSSWAPIGVIKVMKANENLLIINWGWHLPTHTRSPTQLHTSTNTITTTNKHIENKHNYTNTTKLSY